MRTLLIHAEKFWFKVREKAIVEAEEKDILKEYEGNNALVVFVTVELNDYSGGEEFIEGVSNNIIDVLKKIRASEVVIYPYAHLSRNLAPPHEAIAVLKMLEEALKRRDVKVVRAPFGWYKSFNIKCYGHPLSELSREFAPITTRRYTISKEYYVLTPNGEVYKADEFRTDDKELKILIDKEVFKKELPGGEAKIIELCRKFGFEWEPMSDAGHMRYGPHATVIVESVMEYSWKVAKSLGIPIFRIKGTNMFNLKFKPVKEHADLFGDRLYEVETDSGKLVLRYAACHQQFAMIKDWIISYKDLPFGAFELADSYRYEQSGEVMLCFRLRKFYMPDLHIFTRDLEEAKKMSMLVQAKILEEIEKLGRRYVAIYNVTKDFFENHRDFLIELIKREGRPALIEVVPSGIYYWVLNVEYNIIDFLRRPREIATFQIDIGNAKRFGIKYVDEYGNEKYPVIIHTAIIGGIERYIYTVFDKALQDEARGKIPSLPTWLSPIQARVIPVSKQFYDYANEVLNALLSEGIRADMDDRDLSLGKKIREAGIEWIPYVIVVGAREKETKTVNVRIRHKGIQKSMKIDELIKMIKEEIRDYPQVDSALPIYLSRRPTLHYLREVEMK
ncbi:MAG: threonine--tRNA ligase [Desulfurococcales archaeon ex4484_42]|nr:MAG: threonine--tRNA ligase [Desulfurococcales archaeon ex4484_42]